MLHADPHRLATPFLVLCTFFGYLAPYLGWLVAPAAAEGPVRSKAIAAPPSIEWLDLQGGISICPVADPSPRTQLAAAYLKSDLERRFRLSTAVLSAGEPVPPAGVRVVIGESGDAGLAEAVGRSEELSRPDAYTIRISARERRVVVAGSAGSGVIRGVFALADLTNDSPAGPRWAEKTVSSAPGLAIRFTRDIFGGREPALSARESDLCQLDWWARWGLNYTLLPSRITSRLPQTQSEATWYLHEARARGMHVGANLGGRSLCASDDDQMSAYLADASHLLELGCDFLVVLFDDLPSSRTAGHCERCIERFGGSLAREQRFILESLQSRIRRAGGDRKLIWCPTYYSLGMTGYRKAAEGPEAYFTILGESPAVRDAWMFHCAFDRSFNAYLDRTGLTHRIWWYNGIRTSYYMVKREFDGYEPWGPRLAIPGLKDFGDFFSPFENGWLMPTFATAEPDVHPSIARLKPAERDAQNRTVIPDESWAELRGIGGRTEGVYFCGATEPYHIAMTGIFAADPQHFRQSQAAGAVLAAMFGTKGAGLAAQWQAAYADAQMILARAKGTRLTGDALRELIERADRMESSEAELRTCVAADSPVLPQAILDPLLDDMTRWRRNVRRFATEPPESK